RCGASRPSSARRTRAWRSSRCRTANATPSGSGSGPTTSSIPPRTRAMQTLHASSPDDYHAALAAHPRLLVDYHKDDCPGCRMLDMSLQKFAGDAAAAELVLLKVKLETIGEDLFRGLGLRQTPTLSLFRDGIEVTRLPGFQAPGQISRAVALWLPAAEAAEA